MTTTSPSGSDEVGETAGESPSLLILNRQQFGYHTDTYYYCEYLRRSFRITYLCWDYGKAKIEIDGVDVKYVSRDGAKWLRYWRFLKAAIDESRKAFDLVFVKYFPCSSLLRMFARGRRYILDIRTRSVVGNRVKLAASNTLLLVEARCFRHITVISDSLARSLALPRKRVHLLPLGAEIIATAPKSFEKMRLLYIGTLSGRRIHQTVRGFADFLADVGTRGDYEYVIIGSGFNREEEALRDLVSRLSLDGVVRVLGFLPRSELRPFFEEQNIGVAYIPMTAHFDTQPPTKLFEYLLAGLPVIATRTTENRRIITDSNGILVEDTADGFRDGLMRIRANLSSYSSDRIRAGAIRYSWSTIVQGNLRPYLKGLLEPSGAKSTLR
jgi:glycosyltransferase involved in cell wall biosynthesis